MRWILPGQLDAAIATWFGRFPAGLDSREDAFSWVEQAHGLDITRTMGMVTLSLFNLFFSIEAKDERDRHVFWIVRVTMLEPLGHLRERAVRMLIQTLADRLAGSTQVDVLHVALPGTPAPPPPASR